MRTGTLLAALAMSSQLGMVACSPGSGKAPSREVVEQVDLMTVNAAICLQSILGVLEQFDSFGRDAIDAEFDTFWVTLNSLRLNLQRIDDALRDDPDVIPIARNFWRGRVAASIDLYANSMLFDDEVGTIESRMREKFGAERFRRENRMILELSRSIESILREPGPGVVP